MMRARMTFLSEMDAIVKVLYLISLISQGEAEMVKDGRCQDLKVAVFDTKAKAS